MNLEESVSVTYSGIDNKVLRTAAGGVNLHFN